MAKFHLEVMGGLCSRLRAILGAIGHCELTGKELVVFWDPKAHRLTEYDGKFLARMSDIWDHPFTEVDEPQAPRYKVDLNLLDPARPGDVFFRTCHYHVFACDKFKKPLIRYLDMMTPTKEVQALISPYRRTERPGEMQNKSTRRIGVNARYHISQPEWLDMGPANMIISRMKQLVLINPKVEFFLSADDRNVSREIHEKVDAKIVEREKDYRYDRGGILNQAADLYLLGECDWLLGSFKSSFSQLAGWLIKSPASYQSELAQSPRYEDARNPADDTGLNLVLGVGRVVDVTKAAAGKVSDAAGAVVDKAEEAANRIKERLHRLHKEP